MAHLPLAADTRLCLDPDAGWTSDHDALLISTEAAEARVLGLPRPRALVVLEILDGKRTLAQVTERTGATLDELSRWLTPLVEAGIARVCREPADWLPASRFAELCRAVFPDWKRRLFSHPLWCSLADGSAPRNIFLGWLIESYHFIEGVTQRLPMCICLCANPRIRAHFVRHFAEEYDHRHFFLQALAAAGLPAAQRRVLLPGTRAVLNCMREAARRDVLAYTACSAFLESTGTDRANARTFFERLAAHYDGSSAPVVTPMADHVGLDEAYGHGSFMEKICGEMEVITRDRADEALSAAWSLVETLELWSQDILDHYRHHEAGAARPQAYPTNVLKATRPAMRAAAAVEATP